MYTFVIAFYLFICVALVMSILLQSAKGEGLAGAFGGSAMTGTVFGGRGAATFLSRATTFLGATFMLMALAMAFMNPSTGASSLRGTSAVEEAVRDGQIPATQAPPITQGQQPGQPAADQATPIEQLFEDPQSTDQSGDDQ